MFKSISARMAVRIVIVSLILLVGIGTLVTSTAISMQRNEILQRGKILAKSGAATYAAILQRGVESKAIQWDDLVTPKYTEIHFPVKVEEPRFNSTFDGYTDTAGIQFIEDSMTASDPMVLYAIGNDLTGYIPTTLSAFSHQPTGNAKADAVNARSKRRFTSEMHKTAAAWTGDEPLVQEYHRDTGHVAWDVAQPIWLRNPADNKIFHWGSFRVGLRQDRIAEVRSAVIKRLGAAFLLFELVLVSFMYVAIRRQLRPLRKLLIQAEAVSTGASNEIIATRAGDASEVCDIGTAMRRLQRSLSAAMARLPIAEHDTTSVCHPTLVTEVPR